MAMENPFEGKEVWFGVGSQDLYGEEALRQVAEQSGEIVDALNATGKIPVKVVLKPTLKSSDGVKAVITKASKATLNRMNSRITKEIQQLLDSGDNSLEDYPHSQWLYERIAELEWMRKYIKLLKKMKSNRVPAKLRTLWLSRIKNSSRTLASTSLDPMSIALPVQIGRASCRERVSSPV